MEDGFHLCRTPLSLPFAQARTGDSGAREDLEATLSGMELATDIADRIRQMFDRVAETAR